MAFEQATKLKLSFYLLLSGDAPACDKGTTLSTDNGYHYEDTGLDLSKADGVVFKVKACHDAHVALSASNNLNSNMYEIVLGGWLNTKSAIR